MIKKLKELLIYMNEKGVPLPQVRDHGKGSVSLTLMILSSIFVMLGLIHDTRLLINGVNFYEALLWHVTASVLYYNRGAKISKTGIEISASAEKRLRPPELEINANSTPKQEGK